MTERLVSVAVRRDGEIHSRGFKSHWDLRAALGDAEPWNKNRSDEEGFLTSEGRFVGRWEAAAVAFEAGQSSGCGRELLSSDINWTPQEPTAQPAKKLRKRRERS
ncbi:hypothetical protein FNL55_12810 [Tardiphaga sp. vice352]|uniref:hypothetical protein n=1 Tax=Tardiphaga sp. vice352 TaxID=2592816 RepID=UPI0011653EF0|nr:hypothetical protein [Tardiphaga sp. vice352]QDM32120.1 hypothetical protein FNL55_12810 [Tardiphaga sp. vice352]